MILHLSSVIQVRLEGGPVKNAGRVQVQHNGVWGYVCGDSWSITEGHVACREIGYAKGVLAVPKQSPFGDVTDTVIMEGVHCGGFESSLAFCAHVGWKLSHPIYGVCRYRSGPANVVCQTDDPQHNGK